MENFTVNLCNINIEINCIYGPTKVFCKDYLSDGKPKFTVSVTNEDIDKEREIFCKENQNESELFLSDKYLEKSALLRIVSEKLIDYDILLFHGSVVAYKGAAVMFTAKSGTGKTTHSNLWVNNIKGSYYLNGDKPFLLFKDEKIFACSNPWQGKENFGTNEILPLKAVFFLERSDDNYTENVCFSDIFPKLLAQCHHTNESCNLVKDIKLLGNFNNIRLINLYCNMDKKAVQVSFNAVKDLF